MKKVLSMILVATMLVCMMPTMVFADEAPAPKFYAEVASGETTAYVSVGADYNIKGEVRSTSDAFNVNTTDVRGKVEMTDVASLGITGTRSHSVAYDLSAYLPSLNVSLVAYMDQMMGRVGDGDVTLNVAGQAPVTYTFDVAAIAQDGEKYVKAVTGTVDNVDNARIVWAEMASHVTAGAGEQGSSAGVIAEGSYIVAGGQTLKFHDTAVLDPNGPEGIVEAVEAIQNAAVLEDGGEGLVAYLKAGSTVQVGDSQAVLEDDAIIELTAPGVTVPAGVLEGFREAVNSEEGNKAVTLVAMVIGMADELAGSVASGVVIDVEFIEAEDDTPDTPVYYPTYVAPDPLPPAKTEASNAVSTYVPVTEYEAEEAAEIEAIIAQAKKDIAAAKTVEEVEAIEAAAKAEIDKIETAEEKAVIAEVEDIKFKARSVKTTLHGKRAVKITWNVPAGMEFDGFEVFRSTERFSGFGTEPFWTTTKTSYINNKDLEEGNTYYYKVRAFKMVNDEKVYTEYSYKAWRTI